MSETTPRPWRIAAALGISGGLHVSLLALLPGPVHPIPPVPAAPMQARLEEKPPLPPPPTVAWPRPTSPTPRPVAAPSSTQKLAAPIDLAPAPVSRDPAPPTPQVRAEAVAPPAVANTAPAPTPPTTASPASAPITPPQFALAYLSNPEPPYPAMARRSGLQGTVVLKVRVSREGLPVAVEVDRSSGHAMLDRAAQDAVQRWRFVPARQGETSVEAAAMVPIVFRLN